MQQQQSPEDDFKRLVYLLPADEQTVQGIVQRRFELQSWLLNLDKKTPAHAPWIERASKLLANANVQQAEQGLLALAVDKDLTLNKIKAVEHVINYPGNVDPQLLSDAEAMIKDVLAALDKLVKLVPPPPGPAAAYVPTRDLFDRSLDRLAHVPPPAAAAYNEYQRRPPHYMWVPDSPAARERRLLEERVAMHNALYKVQSPVLFTDQ